MQHSNNQSLMSSKLGIGLLAVATILVGVAVSFIQGSVDSGPITGNWLYIALMVVGAVSLGFLLVRNWLA